MRFLFSTVGDCPWVQLGDFNMVRTVLDRLEGFDSMAADEFNNYIADIEMEDMF